MKVSTATLMSTRGSTGLPPAAPGKAASPRNPKPSSPKSIETWGWTTRSGQDWETFNRYAYAADLVIPIIDLGQTDAWVPSTNRGIWGERLWRYGFLLNLAGWIITALGAGALTGIIQKERD